MSKASLEVFYLADCLDYFLCLCFFFCLLFSRDIVFCLFQLDCCFKFKKKTLTEAVFLDLFGHFWYLENKSAGQTKTYGLKSVSFCSQERRISLSSLPTTSWCREHFPTFLRLLRSNLDCATSALCIFPWHQRSNTTNEESNQCDSVDEKKTFFIKDHLFIH